MPKIKVCPICHKAFIQEGKRATCSTACADRFSVYSYRQRAQLVAKAEELKRPPLTDCKCYMDGVHPTCTGLTALWCEWEECKFYKPKFMKKNQSKRK